MKSHISTVRLVTRVFSLKQFLKYPHRKKVTWIQVIAPAVELEYVNLFGQRLTRNYLIFISSKSILAICIEPSQSDAKVSLP